jgi:hypothetical protein
MDYELVLESECHCSAGDAGEAGGTSRQGRASEEAALAMIDPRDLHPDLCGYF